jgi:hypothetical protein
MSSRLYSKGYVVQLSSWFGNVKQHCRCSEDVDEMHIAEQNLQHQAWRIFVPVYFPSLGGNVTSDAVI